MLHMAVDLMTGSMAFLYFRRKSVLTAVRRIFGRIMHSQTALRGQWDKGWKNNLLFASPSIRRPTANHNIMFFFIMLQSLYQLACSSSVPYWGYVAVADLPRYCTINNA